MTETDTTLSAAERLKLDSRGLRGVLSEELDSDAPKLTHQAETLIKFHGMYQQKDRDRRRPEERHLGPKPFVLMVRGRIPGGRLSARQWAAWDALADRYATDGLRLTTRQSIELHGILKGDAKPVVRELAAALSSTTGACGDVVRNVLQALNPRGLPHLSRLDAVADRLSDHFKVKSRAYAEIFIDGVRQETADDAAEPESEPLYGPTYLPRKFKIAVAAVGRNDVDVYTQDLAFAAVFAAGEVAGYHVFAGGGMGLTHGDEATFARLADHLGYVPAAALLPVAEAVVTTQRDFGDRADRNQARLKYTIARRGLPWFRAEVEARAGVAFEERPLPAWRAGAESGWITRHDGTLALAFHILSGRLKDTPDRPLKSTIALLVAAYDLAVQITSEQDLLLLGIAPQDRSAIEALLTQRGIEPASPARIFDRALTCVALPLCSKAFAEAERVGDELFTALDERLARHGVAAKAPVVRITGCPNGCARPYAAEIGLVGQLPARYAVYLGGNAEGTRLAVRTLEKVPYAALPATLDRLFALWAREGGADERLGDFVHRWPRDALLATLTAEDIVPVDAPDHVYRLAVTTAAAEAAP